MKISLHQPSSPWSRSNCEAPSSKNFGRLQSSCVKTAIKRQAFIEIRIMDAATFITWTKDFNSIDCSFVQVTPHGRMIVLMLQFHNYIISIYRVSFNEA